MYIWIGFAALVVAGGFSRYDENASAAHESWRVTIHRCALIILAGSVIGFVRG